MEKHLAAEVEATLSKMDHKYDVDCPAPKGNSSKNDLVKSLYKEFDSLGIYEKKDDVDNRDDLMTDIIENSFKLIQVHRQLLKNCNQNKIESTRLKEDNVNLQKTGDQVQTGLIKLYNTIEQLKRRLSLEELQRRDLDEIIMRQKNELELMKKTMESDRTQLQHKVKRLECKNEILQESNKKKIGTFTSRDFVFVEAIEKYKRNEEVYKDTINKLQENNRQLLEEILNLKQEVLTVLCKDNN